MELGTRSIFWVGPQSYLVRLKAGPGRPRVVSIEPCPVEAARAHGIDPGELAGWLAPRVRKGEELDVVYQQHILQTESFPQMGSGDVGAVLRTRLSRELLVPPDELESHTVRLDTPTATHAVFAGVMASLHRSLGQAALSAGANLGRVAFGGQIAVRALANAAGPGSWTLTPGVGNMGGLLLAIDSAGNPLARGLPPATAPDPGSVSELLRLHLPGTQPATEPMSLASAGAAALSGLPLPSPLDALFPTLSTDPACRRPSPNDLEYPHHFAGSTWTFAVAALAMLLYTGALGTRLRDIAGARTDISKLEARRSELSGRKSATDTRLAALQNLQKHVRGVGAEDFDNGSWLTWLGKLRDEQAPPLLFDAIRVEGAGITLSGRHDSAGPILAFASALATSVGQEHAQLQSFVREESGRHSFVLHIRRGSSTPPEPPSDEDEG
ncbi:MAG: hypothetical protein HYY25_09685 [Candidatus Wallbacteria bacterium]|nr:hypothetical protein [Candidatus Wallbacteria bacterium]